MNHTNDSTPLAAPREMRPVDASIVMTFLSIKLLEAIILILLELELDDAVKVLGAVVVVCTVDLGGAGVTFFDGGASVNGCVAFLFEIPGAVDIFREAGEGWVDAKSKKLNGLEFDRTFYPQPSSIAVG